MTDGPEKSLTGTAIQTIVRNALNEDIGRGDVTSIATIGEAVSADARLTAKEDGVLSGTGPAALAFELVDPEVLVDWRRADGEPVSKGEVIGRVSGNARAILSSERTALNILQRMSGIATATNRMVVKARPFGARILDTRKTGPGIRILDKLAVLHGGGLNHRFGLFDMILIKDNHISASGSVVRALADADAYRSDSGDESLKIEIEARTLEEVLEVIDFWESYGVPDRILLDNMARKRSNGELDTATLAEAVALISGRIETEASGNVEVETVAAIAAAGVDFISSGALTHSVRALDISLEFSL